MKKKLENLQKVSDFFQETQTKKVKKEESFGDGKIFKDIINLSCWNVDGLRAILRKGDLQKYIKDYNPDILCLSETKISEIKFELEQVIHKFDQTYPFKQTYEIEEQINRYFNFCKPPFEGYSGVAVFSKFQPMSLNYDFDMKQNQEGRSITVEFEKFYLVTTYVPNAGMRLDYRVNEWDTDFRNYLGELKKKKRVILCGDLNCAHKEIDIARPKSNIKSAGFGKLLESGFIDIFRQRNPSLQKFSEWTYKFNARSKNIGWRLDYFLLDSSIPDSAVIHTDINNDLYGSNHCPVELTLDITRL